MTSQTSWPHMEKVLGTTRKRFTWYAFESSLMHLHTVRTCTAIDLAATWFLTRQSSIIEKTWCGKTIWSRSLASSRLSVVTAPFNTSQKCRHISNLFGMRLMLLCIISPHSQRGHLPISLLIMQTHWVPCFRRGVSTNIPWTWWIWRSSLHNPVRLQPSLLRHKSTKIRSSMTPARKHLTLPCNHWIMDLVTTSFG